MSDEKTGAVIHRFIAAFLERDPAAFVDLVAEDCVMETMQPAPAGARYEGHDANVAFWQAMVLDRSRPVTPDNSTLIVAESYGKKLTAFDISPDGSLSNRRVWADLHDGVPDGICLDVEGAVWYADVPNKRCVRVREGGAVLQTVDVGLGCFACVLGGLDLRTLFIVSREWRGVESAVD